MNPISKYILLVITAVSLIINIYLWKSLNSEDGADGMHSSSAAAHIQPRPGECGIEMKNSLAEWEPMILVYGYADDYEVAAKLVEVAEKEGSRPPGSFRVKVY